MMPTVHSYIEGGGGGSRGASCYLSCIRYCLVTTGNAPYGQCGMFLILNDNQCLPIACGLASCLLMS